MGGTTTTIITSLLEAMDAAGMNFVQTVYQQLAGEVKNLFRMLLMVYVIFWGLQIWMGQATAMPMELAARLGRVLVVYTIATNWGTFAVLIYDVVTKLPDQIGMSIMSAVGNAANPGSGPSTSSGSVASAAVGAALNQIYDAGVKLVGQVYSGSALDLIGALLAVLVLAGMVAFVGVAVAIIVASKLLMFIALSLGPIFIILAMYNWTTHYMHGFIRLVTGLMVSVIFVYAFLGFYSTLMTKAIAFAAPSGDGTVTTKLGQIVPYLLLCLIGFYVIMQIQSMAMAVTGSSAGGVGSGYLMSHRLFGVGTKAGVGAAAATAGIFRTAGRSSNSGRGESGADPKTVRSSQYSGGAAAQVAVANASLAESVEAQAADRSKGI